jgi:UDP-N-acetylmuramate--alanine ligase
MSQRPSLPPHVFMLGIGGIGMSALARHLTHNGHRVAGYDLTPSPVTAALLSEGIEVVFDPHPEALPSWVVQTPAPDLLLVHTPAVPRDLPLRVWMDSRGIRPMKRAE